MFEFAIAHATRAVGFGPTVRCCFSFGVFTKMSLARSLTLVSLILVMSGCGGGGGAGRPKLAPAAGVAKFKGQPIHDATITFYPEKGPVAVGRTDADGKFAVKTNGQLGAVVGKNKVTVIEDSNKPEAEIPPAGADAMKYAISSTFSKKYTDPNTTDLVIDIPTEGNTELVLDLTP